jgi:hypothetical protein
MPKSISFPRDTPFSAACTAVEAQEVVSIQTREAGVLRLRLTCGLWKVLGTKQFGSGCRGSTPSVIMGGEKTRLFETTNIQRATLQTYP